MKASIPPDYDPHEFGIDWDEKAKKLKMPFIPKITKHQYMAYHGLGDVPFHRKERIKTFWPDYQWYRWGERRLKADSERNWLTWIGPASSGKTVDGGVFDLEWWLQAPHESAVILCSTTMKMLRKRIWAAVAHYHQSLPKGIGAVGELMDSVTTIRWKQGDDVHAIFGIAVEEGAIEEVINNLLGIKAKRVRLRIDEGQGIREAILKATTNMSKNPIFQFRMMGNPESIHNPLIRESEPIDGWDSVVRGETEEWETLGGPVVGRGLCQFFDGRKSPADDSPEERARLPFLINKDHIEAHLKSVRGNLNDPSFWSQCVGWPPPVGLESTLIDDSIILTFHCKDKAVWTEGFRKFAALDPAGTGGDKKMLVFGKFGQTVNDDAKKRWVIQFDEEVNVPIDVKAERPLDFQIVDFTKVECQKRGIKFNEFACASAGAGGPLCSIFEQQWGPIVRIQEGGSPDEKHIIDEAGKTAKEAYDTRATELLFNLRDFAMADGIRGLSHDAAFQACSRRTFYRNGKYCAEPKVGSKGRRDEKDRPIKGYKERLGHSPDNLDACCIGIEYCRLQGATPTPDIVVSQSDPYDKYEDEFSSDNYLKPYDYAL